MYDTVAYVAMSAHLTDGSHLADITVVPLGFLGGPPRQ